MVKYTISIEEKLLDDVKSYCYEKDMKISKAFCKAIKRLIENED